jgi:hypothetical protein
LRLAVHDGDSGNENEGLSIPPSSPKIDRSRKGQDLESGRFSGAEENGSRWAHAQSTARSVSARSRNRSSRTPGRIRGMMSWRYSQVAVVRAVCGA